MNYEPLTVNYKPFNPQVPYGFFGYKGHSIELALKRDDVDGIREAHKRGWIDTDTITLDSTPLRRMALKKGSVNVEQALAELGYPA